MSLLQMSACGGVLILAVSFLRLFTLRVLPKRTFLILWAIVLIRLNSEKFSDKKGITIL